MKIQTRKALRRNITGATTSLQGLIGFIGKAVQIIILDKYEDGEEDSGADLKAPPERTVDKPFTVETATIKVTKVTPPAKPEAIKPLPVEHKEFAADATNTLNTHAMRGVYEGNNGIALTIVSQSTRLGYMDVHTLSEDGKYRYLGGGQRDAIVSILVRLYRMSITNITRLYGLSPVSPMITRYPATSGRYKNARAYRSTLQENAIVLIEDTADLRKVHVKITGADPGAFANAEGFVEFEMEAVYEERLINKGHIVLIKY